MRSIPALRLATRALNASIPPRAICRAITYPSTRHLSTTPSLLKKNKAVQTKKNAKQAEESGAVDTGIDVEEVLAKTEPKMKKAADWANKSVYDMVERGRGRVSPALLDGVKVVTSDIPGGTSLNNVASITVQKSTLVVEVWDQNHFKPVQQAIHAANMPGISPRAAAGSNTLHIPIIRPTHEQRQALLKQIAETVEAGKVSVRRARTEGMNGIGGRKEEGADDVDKLSTRYVEQLDKLLAQAKKEFEKA